MARLPRPPAVVWLLAAAQVMLSVSFALLTPAFQGPDETQHVDMVIAVGELHQWPEVGERLLSRQVRDAQKLEQFRLMGSPRHSDDAIPRVERPSFESLEAERPTAGTNHINQHPPLYYAVENAWTGLVVTLSPVDLSAFDRTVLTMRSLGAVFGGLVVVLAWWTATVAGCSARLSLTAAAVPLAIPMFTYVQGSVSNDTLLTVLVAALTLQLVRVLRDGPSTRAGVVAGVLAGGAMVTKLFGLVSLPMIAVTALLMPTGTTWHGRLRFGFTAAAVGLFAGGWWWLRNLMVEGVLQPEGLSYNRTPDPTPDVLTYLKGVDLRLWQGFYGRFGNLNTAIPRWLLIVLTLLVLGGAVLALVAAIRRRTPLDMPVVRSAVIVAMLPALLIVVGELARVAYRYTTLGRLAGLQGRYVFLGMVGIAIFSAAGLWSIRRPRWTTSVMAILIAAAQLVSMYALLRQFWGAGRGAGVDTSVRALIAWAPFDGPWTISWILLSIAVLGLALSLLVRAVAGGTRETSYSHEVAPRPHAERT